MEWERRVLGALVIVVGLFGCVATARAAEEQAPPDYARSGPYVGLGFIYAPSVFNVGRAESDLGGTVTGNNAFGLDARAGYRIWPYFAAEGHYQFVPGFQLDRGGGGRLTSLRTNTLTLDGKVFAMTATLQPYLVGGVGFLHSSASADVPGFSGDGTGFAGRIGAGADYYLRPDVVLNIEFSAVLPTGPVADVRFLPLVFDAQYRF